MTDEYEYYDEEEEGEEEEYIESNLQDIQM